MLPVQEEAEASWNRTGAQGRPGGRELVELVSESSWWWSRNRLGQIMVPPPPLARPGLAHGSAPAELHPCSRLSPGGPPAQQPNHRVE